MNRSILQNFQQWISGAGAVGGASHHLEAGQARGLQAQRPAVLRVMQGRAWITLGDGPHGQAGERSGDGFLHAGQTLRIGAGQQVVIEAADGAALQWSLQGPTVAPTVLHWWQRAQVGPRDEALCCA